MSSEVCYCSDCGRRLTPGSQRGCCQNPDHATGQLRQADVIGALYRRELDRAEQSLLTALLTRFDGHASEAELRRVLGCADRFLYEVAAPRGRHAALISGCLYEQDRFSVTDQARDAFLARAPYSVRRSASAGTAAA